ncbi:glycoside hydrolase family 18 protein [Prevotella sp. P6B1]|uniref:glycoside hydrolase family 18 protein n=1 Tax=Prevotella sp. P6B1 TaxID=1410613 RepID=UPI0009E008C8|nr:glycosyl hydrolase family 18 protein [Prevotella sp. P6B1]
MRIKNQILALLGSLLFYSMMPLSNYAQATNTTSKKVVAYVTSWSSISVDPHVMTHINYAFGGIGNDYKVYVDNSSRFSKIVALKKKNPELKILLSIGGWGRGNFTPVAKDAYKRKIFSLSCRAFCEKWGIDGVDIDWEFPGSNSSGESSPVNERQNYTYLLRDLRETLGDDLLLTMASSASPDYYNFVECIQYLDFVNVMTYDMASPPYHHSALYRGGTVGNGWCVGHESIQNHLEAGIPKEKLVMGLAFYGNGNADGSGSANQITLQEIKNGIAKGKWIDHWDDVAKVPYITNTKGRFVFGYDDERSLTIKCQYIHDNDLAGGMYWEYANDDNVGTERTTVYNCLIGNSTTAISDTKVVNPNYLSSKTYNLQGLRVMDERLKPGFYIRDGRKILVK